jgi:hypothetical protein
VFLSFLLIFVLGLVSAFVFAEFVRLARPSWTITLIGLFILWLVFGQVLGVYTYGNTFLGAAALCGLVPVAALVLLGLIAARGPMFRRWNLEQDRLRKRLYVAGIFLIPLACSAPFSGTYTVPALCNAWTRHEAHPLTKALEAYQRDHSAYPETLDELVPDYIEEIPSARCFEPYDWFDSLDYPWNRPKKFSISKCGGDVTIITAPTLVYDWLLRYDVSHQQWSRISILDGDCSFLPSSR